MWYATVERQGYCGNCATVRSTHRNLDAARAQVARDSYTDEAGRHRRPTCIIMTDKKRGHTVYWDGGGPRDFEFIE